MVAEWVDVWAPVVLSALAETEQPVTLILDSADFWWTNARTRIRRREFAVLVAYGYTASGLDTAFRRLEAWEEFRDGAVAELGHMASTRALMGRMGHASMDAALIYPTPHGGP